MKKPYLLISGYDYYPSRATGDWVCCFETEEEAYSYKISDLHEWKRVIDVREWAE